MVYMAKKTKMDHATRYAAAFSQHRASDAALKKLSGKENLKTPRLDEALEKLAGKTSARRNNASDMAYAKLAGKEKIKTPRLDEAYMKLAGKHGRKLRA